MGTCKDVGTECAKQRGSHLSTGKAEWMRRDRGGQKASRGLATHESEFYPTCDRKATTGFKDGWGGGVVTTDHCVKKTVAGHEWQQEDHSSCFGRDPQTAGWPRAAAGR